MENIYHSSDALLPWQRPIPKKQNLKNKGNYVGSLTGKIQDQRYEDNRTRAFLQVLPVRIIAFVETLRSHLKQKAAPSAWLRIYRVATFTRKMLATTNIYIYLLKTGLGILDF